MEIYLLRHGIAEDGRAGQADADRELTDEGREKLRRVLKRARSADVALSLILTSPYRRAAETAAIAAEVLGYKNKLEETRALLPNASPEETWEEIRTRKDEKAILLASHEPLMSTLAAFLLACPALHVDMKKGGLMRIDFDHFGREPHGLLKWLLTPSLA